MTYAQEYVEMQLTPEERTAYLYSLALRFAERTGFSLERSLEIVSQLAITAKPGHVVQGAHNVRYGYE